MPRVIAYHPEILVARGDELFSLRVDLNDWYGDDEVLRKLAAETGGRTAGEVVVAVERKELKGADDSIISARISKVGSEHVVAAAAEGRPVLQWDEEVA
jgi:hypothetical protein